MNETTEQTIWKDTISSGQFKIIVEGEFDLLAVADSEAFINWLGDQVFIIGAEGFRHDGTNIIPDMDCIIDFSALGSKDAMNNNSQVAKIIKDGDWASKVELLLR